MAERVMSIMCRAKLGGRDVARCFVNLNTKSNGVMVMAFFLDKKHLGQPLMVELPQACLFRALKLRDQIQPLKSANDSLIVEWDVYNRLLAEKKQNSL